MDNNTGTISCPLGCLLVAALGGLLAFVLLMLLGGWGFLQAVFGAGVLALAIGVLLSVIICRPLTPLGQNPWDVAQGNASAKPAPVKAAKPAPAQAPAPAAAPVSAPAPAEASDAPKVKPSTPLAGQAELAARKGEWKYTAPKAAATAAPAPAAALDEAVEEAEPELLNAARNGKPDDLKLIKGVGPKLEQTLNELGFYHFDQIAAWTDAEIAWVDTRLKFKGRIQRDDWTAQARILADGGETEFSKRNA